MTQYLNQVLAVERNVKARSTKVFTELHRAAGKPALFNGLVKKYEPADADGETFPDEQNLVQHHVRDVVRSVRQVLDDWFDVTLTKDVANANAVADIVVGGQVVASRVPATTLIFLEKRLVDLHTFLEGLTTLDPAHEWSLDDATGLYKTPPQRTHRTKKVQKPIVLYQATDHHPAQTQLITEDVVVGFWNQVRHSGAIPRREKEQMLERLEELQKAVKYAREEANRVEAPQQTLGGVLSHIFQG